MAVLVVSLPRSVDGPGTSAAREPPALPDKLSPAEQDLSEQIAALGEGFDGEAGLAFRDNQTGRIIHYQGDALYPQQSVSKLWVAMAALAQASAGELDLQDSVTIRRADLTVFYQPIRSIVRQQGSYTTDYADLLSRALTRSDNTANDVLLRRVGGPEAVQAWLNGAGLGAIRFGTDERTKQSAIAGLEWSQAFSYGGKFFDARDRVPDARRRAAFEGYLSAPMDGASPVLMAVALGRLAEGNLLDTVSTELLLSTLEETRSGPKRLKGGLPDGWTIAHKTGTGQYFGGEQSGYNDVGILTAPDGRTYTVVAMIRRTSAPNGQRMELMQELVRAVGRYHEVAKAPAAGA
ncbi:serine hydrolase [Paraurantiacibacter namhicola]|uniref:serine hydrolase n=1 Tax=Paraurantiacibacter namhicola TaxID=645517 RepID=UPI001F2E80E1|nr:serine hydrolase [Paraurantiacibacter namhicola]